MPLAELGYYRRPKGSRYSPLHYWDKSHVMAHFLLDQRQWWSTFPYNCISSTLKLLIKYILYLILVSTMHNVGLGDACNNFIGSFIAVAIPVKWEQKVHKCGTAYYSLQKALCHTAHLIFLIKHFAKNDSQISLEVRHFVFCSDFGAVTFTCHLDA